MISERNQLGHWKAAALCLLIFLSLMPLTAQTPSARKLSEQDAKSIAALIIELDSDDFSRRERAMDALRAKGVIARPYLTKALKNASLELRIRLDELLSQMPSDERTDLNGPSEQRISLTLEDATLDATLKKIGQATGVKILPNGMKYDRLISLSIKDASLLEALDILADSLDASWHMDGRISTVRLVAAGVNTPHRVYSGPVRIAAERFMNNRSLSFGGQPINSCYLQLRIDVEPDAHLIGLWQPLQSTNITDDKGQALALPAARTARFQSVAGRSTHSFTIPMKSPSAQAGVISLLEGTIELAFPKSYERVTLPLPEPGINPEPNGTESVRIQSVSPRSNPRRVVVIEAIPRPLQVDGAVNTGVQDRRAAFLMADGTRVEIKTLPHPRRQGNKEIFTLTLPSGEIESIQFERLTAVRSQTVKFKIRDLPLP